MAADSFVSLNSTQTATLTACFERIFPADAATSGATEIGAVVYLDQALAGAYAGQLSTYRRLLDGLQQVALARNGRGFATLTIAQQNALLQQLQCGGLPELAMLDQPTLFETLRVHCLEGLFSDPAYGGNRHKEGWRVLGHPGIWLENSAEEQLAKTPITKDGRIQSLADIDLSTGSAAPNDLPANYDPAEAWKQPPADADVIIVGAGGVGGFIAPMLCEAGLRVVALEAGPYWQIQDFLPDELGAAYYCRGNMGTKFSQETPRWRRNASEPTTEATFSLGKMVNGVGGSIIHYGAWLRRFHPHHLRWRSHIIERWGESAIPKDCTVVDWPIAAEELEPWYTRIEQQIGVAGDDRNPFVSRSRPLPLPPTRPFRMGQEFDRASTQLGLHPHASPVGFNTEQYNGYPASSYCSWNNGFGAWTGEKWHPGLTSIPAAVATGNYSLRTQCRVIRVLTDANGRAEGVEYLDPDGTPRVQYARVVILAAYTFENVRLMFLSGDAHHQSGLGNNHDQLGLNFMTKMFTHVDGYFPDRVFNRHTGPAAQAVVLDDFLAESFDPMAAGGFIGGGTLGAENQFLPLQIAMESLPDRVPRWGAAFKDHLRQWQHLAVVRTQPDMLPYVQNRIDLDPVSRDRSGLGLPVVRLTFDLQDNESRQAAFFETKSAEILHEMGAVETWNGPRFTGVGSSHDLGGCRMSNDPKSGVVDRNLEVHDTPGLYVFGGAALPTCPGINPTLTIWAVCALAVDTLIAKLREPDA